MMRPHDFSPALLALLVAAGTGALALFFTLMPSALPLPDDDGPRPPTTMVVETPPTLQLPAYDTYAVIAERPVFNAGRVKDPDSTGPDTAQQQLTPLSNYRLVGLVVSPETQRALVSRPSGETVNLKPGDSLDGRTVVTIGPRGVTLTAEGAEEVLKFGPAAARSPHGLAMAGGSAQANR